MPKLLNNSRLDEQHLLVECIPEIGTIQKEKDTPITPNFHHVIIMIAEYPLRFKR